MKKIILAVSALSAALFSTAANADISISGSANAVYVDAAGNSEGHVGGTISFAMSTVTDSGVTISTSGQITNDPDAAGGAGNGSGMTALSFGFSNGSITVADDVAVPAGTGLVGELVGHADSNQVTHTNDVTIATDDGSGIAASTTIGDMTLAGTYFYDGGHNNDVDGGTTTGAGISLTIPMGDMSLTVSSATVDANGTTDSSTGGALVMPVSGGTLSLGIETTSGDTAATEGEAYSVAYSTTFGGAAVGIGYTGFDANNNTSSKTDITISQSIGGGASIFAEMSNLTGAGAAAATQSTAESVFAVGTSVSF
jgi:hypothetical protein